MSTLYRAKSMRHVGILPLCCEIGACDIGIAELEDGRTVHCTWGRALTLDDVEAGKPYRMADLVECESPNCPNGIEYILPAGASLDRLLSIMIDTKP